MIEHLSPDVVFCAAEPDRYRPLLETVRRHRRPVPVIVVGRLPEVHEWLDALEAGASDYCAPPFDSAMLQWTLNAALKARPAAA